MIRKIFKVTLLLLLVAVCGVGYLGWSRVKNSRLDLDDVELMADPDAALEVDPDILDEIARRKTAGAEEAVQVLNQEETENEYSGLRIVDPKDIVWKSDRLSVIEDKNLINFLLIDQAQKKGAKRQPADLILVCSFNLESKKLTLISIEKDLYVQILKYVKELIACDKNNIKECSVPTEDASERVLLTIGMEVLLPDLEKNQKYLREMIYF